MRHKILDVLRDRNGFLSDYLKDNLPSGYYKRSFTQKIDHVDYIKEIELPAKNKEELDHYWADFEKIDSLWHKAYWASSGIWDVRYIPEDIFYRKIEPKLNRYYMRGPYSDKNIYDQLYPEFQKPETIIRNVNGRYYSKDYNEMDQHIALSYVQVIASEDKFVIKPTLSTGAGKNVQIFDFRGDHPALIREHIEKAFKEYGKDFIVQKYLYQHDLLSEMHPNSLNTIRAISLRLNGEINILSRVLRLGVGGSIVDNGEAGYLTVGIDPEGKLNDIGINHWTYEKYEAHPTSNFRFKDVVLPNMDKVHALIKKAHKKLLYFDIVSWDIALDRLGEPVFIEINLRDQDINYHQRANGPLFGHLTENILEKVYGND